MARPRPLKTDWPTLAKYAATVPPHRVSIAAVRRLSARGDVAAALGWVTDRLEERMRAERTASQRAEARAARYRYEPCSSSEVPAGLTWCVVEPDWYRTDRAALAGARDAESSARVWQSEVRYGEVLAPCCDHPEFLPVRRDRVRPRWHRCQGCGARVALPGPGSPWRIEIRWADAKSETSRRVR